MTKRVLKFYEVSFYLSLFVCSLVIFSCNDDDNMVVEEDLSGRVDLGSYELLPESISRVPFTDNEAVVFIDS